MDSGLIIILVIGLICLGGLLFICTKLFESLTAISEEFKMLDFVAKSLEIKTRKVNELLYSVEKTALRLRRHEIIQEVGIDISESQVINIQEIINQDFSEKIRKNRISEMMQAIKKDIGPEDTVILFDEDIERSN